MYTMLTPTKERWRRSLFNCDRLILLSIPITAAGIVFLIFSFLQPGGPRTPQSQPVAASASASHEHQDAIKAAFDFAWDGYYKLAFPHDELKPISNTPGTTRNDWGATAVDALGTAIMMGKQDVVNIVLDHISKTDFTHTTTPISVFESTIRYVGGMLSAFELLNGPAAQMVPAGFNTNILLEKARSLTDLLSRAFTDGQKIESGSLDPSSFKGNGQNGLAGAGSIVLEWAKLSDLVNNSTYKEKTQQAQNYLMNPQPKEMERFPGLVPIALDVTSGNFQDGYITWGSSADSYYEYLLKMYVYDPKSYGQYKDKWIEAADSTMRYLASSPNSLPDLAFIAKYKDSKFIAESGHLECFAGGNFILGGTVLGQSKYTDFGLKIVEGCHHLYNATKSGIAPEQWKWRPVQCDGQQTDPPWSCDDPQSDVDKQLNNAQSVWISEPSYNLRPEALESYYYAYRLTKNQKYRDYAWDAWLAIDRSTKQQNGYTYLRDVNVEPDQRTFSDNQESFLFSETLKYLFLIFDDSDAEYHFSTDGKSKWLFNTEAHPLKINR